MSPELHNVARTLIELGANVNAYRPGSSLSNSVFSLHPYFEYVV